VNLRLPLVALAVLVIGGPASAGPPGTWTRVTDTNGINTDHVALARTGDGVLHVAWPRHEPDNRDGIVHTPVSPAASVGQATPIVTGWRGINNQPDLIGTADGGLRIFFGGRREAFRNDPNDSLNTATAPASGTGWSLQPGSVTSTTSVYARAVGAALARDGTPVVAWVGNRREAAFHFGVSPSGPEFRYVESLSTETCGCPNDPDIAVDFVTGEIVLAWRSLIRALPGDVYAQTITPTGPSGPPRKAPGSEHGDSQRVGITGRIGAGGVYIGYTSGSPVTGVRLWRYGAAGPAFTIAAPRARFAHVAAAPNGRLWLMWARGDRLYFTRTDKDATEHGDVFSIAAPPGTTSIWRLNGEGSRGPLDVLAHVSTAGSLATWHTQVLPPLEVTAKPDRVSAAGAKGRPTIGVTVKVTDAGEPVRGVKVALAGVTKTTNVQGVARFTVRRGRTYTATATQRGYRKDTAKVKAPKQRR
jgi:hypothetical protein